jgi:predicted dehydrogenase
LINRLSSPILPWSEAVIDARIFQPAVARAAPIITVADALQSLLALQAVRRSIATGQTVALQDLR